ncbi:MAG: flagellar basal body rod protein FlgB [Clostridiales bacterium]|nr:flagellar basal body rod protein FlgB [Clostridiales bacterium]
MINTGIYNYIDVLNKTADAAWLRNESIVNNLANVDTPGYKRQDVSFESHLARELKNSGSLDHRVAGVNIKNLKGTTYTDMAGYSYRLDGNNVDEDIENVEFASNQIKYNAVLDSITSELNRLKTAMS